MTTLALLRLRFKLTVHGRREKVLLVEEANALTLGPDGTVAAMGEEARALLEAPASHDLAHVARERLLGECLARRNGAGRCHRCIRAGRGPRTSRKIMRACGRRASMFHASASKPYCRPTSSASSFSFRRGAEMPRCARPAAPAFDAIEIEGALIAPAMLAKIAASPGRRPE